MHNPLLHPSHPKYRPDIDGLRAFAVLAVIGFHAFPAWVRGGFVGVDVFFVISGFLISTIIFRNLERGSFSFLEFYSRRIKRIFPALLLVLASTFTLGWFVLLTDEYKQLGKHIAGGAGFVSNLMLSSEKGYFDNAAETKPLLHLWSLGIEEQFYIVWPLLLWFAWRLKRNFLTVTLVVATASFLLNIAISRSDVVADFYSPLTRFWELLVGSILAYVTMRQEDAAARADIRLSATAHARRRTMSEISSVLGFSLIILSVVLLSKERAFPGWWALLPTMGALLIMAAGANAYLNRVVLSNRVLVSIGLISFPLYLWHWPLLSFARIVESEMPTRDIRIVAVLASFVLAWLTYEIVEKRIRAPSAAKSKTVGLLVTMVVVGFAGYNDYQRDGLAFRNPTSKASYLAQSSEQGFQEGCSLKFKTIDARHCAEIVTDKPLAIMLGDSHVRHYFEVLKGQITESGFDLIAVSNGGCPFLLGTNTPNGKDCADKNRELVALLQEKKQRIKVILLAGEFSSYASPGTLTDPTGRTLNFAQALRDTLSSLRMSKVIFLDQIPPISFDPKKCIDRPFKITRSDFDCRDTREEAIKGLVEYRSDARPILQSFNNVAVFNMDDMLCSQKYCSAKNGNDLLYYDKTHLNPHGVAFVRGKINFRGFLRSQGIIAVDGAG